MGLDVGVGWMRCKGVIEEMVQSQMHDLGRGIGCGFGFGFGGCCLCFVVLGCLRMGFKVDGL